MTNFGDDLTSDICESRAPSMEENQKMSLVHFQLIFIFLLFCIDPEKLDPESFSISDYLHLV